MKTKKIKTCRKCWDSTLLGDRLGVSAIIVDDNKCKHIFHNLPDWLCKTEEEMNNEEKRNGV